MSATQRDPYFDLLYFCLVTTDLIHKRVRKPNNGGASYYDISSCKSSIRMGSQMNWSGHTADYALGHSEPEIRRLILQAAVLRPMTERLLLAAGLAPGMQVLDLGCGAGDVSLLAAEIVGPTGTVLGVDRGTEALATARSRAAASGLANVNFAQVSVDDAVDSLLTDTHFDAVVGRYILCYLPDPAGTIRRVASQLRPGGILAFHEVDFLDEFRSRPSVPLWEEAGRWLFDSFRPTVAHPGIAGRLIETFEAAGMPTLGLFSERPVGGGANSSLYAWLAESVRSVLPLLQSGSTTVEAVGIETLETRLRQATMVVHGQIVVPAQVCAWSYKR
jgi:ubiquinone/menaquinone biosynthesis C-methylase UbiE